MNEENRLPIVEIQGVHAYIDAQGTAWLNAEDIARGLGFVQVKKDRVPTFGDKSNLLNANETINYDNCYTVVRWERVNEYLREFGYPKKVGKGDYLPESMVYMLAMKANNEAAKKFQRIIAFEIMPALRKYGYYALPAQNKADDYCFTAEEMIAVMEVAKVFGKKSNLCCELQEIEHEIYKAHLELDKLMEKRDNIRKELKACDNEFYSSVEEFSALIARN